MKINKKIKHTNPANIDWDSVSLEHDIDWDNIDFLTFEWDKENNLINIFREKYIPQIGGLKPILAYSQNFVRLVKEFKGGEELINQTDDQLLFDIGMSLARGAEIPIAIGNMK